MKKVTSRSKATVKTTVELPEALWQAAKRRAVDERSDLRRVIIAALERYLERSPKGKEHS